MTSFLFKSSRIIYKKTESRLGLFIYAVCSGSIRAAQE